MGALLGKAIPRCPDDPGEEKSDAGCPASWPGLENNRQGVVFLVAFLADGKRVSTDEERECIADAARIGIFGANKRADVRLFVSISRSSL